MVIQLKNSKRNLVHIYYIYIILFKFFKNIFLNEINSKHKV